MQFNCISWAIVVQITCDKTIYGHLYIFTPRNYVMNSSVRLVCQDHFILTPYRTIDLLVLEGGHG